MALIETKARDSSFETKRECNHGETANDTEGDCEADIGPHPYPILDQWSHYVRYGPRSLGPVPESVPTVGKTFVEIASDSFTEIPTKATIDSDLQVSIANAHFIVMLNKQDVYRIIHFV